MRWSDIHIDACATALGRLEKTADAVADGRYPEEFQTAHGFRSISVTDHEDAVELAVEAGRSALVRARTRPDDVHLVVHSYCAPQAPPQVQPATYVQGRVLGRPCRAYEVNQACDGGLAAVEAAAAHLAAVAPEGAAALLTTSDKHPPEDGERYRADPGCVPGDGGTALVLSRSGGFARLLSTAVISDGTHSRPNLVSAEAFATRAEFVAEQRRRLLPMLRAMAELQQGCAETALADAGLKSGDIARWVLAHTGNFLANQSFHKAFGIEDAMTTWDWGSTVGHFGSGDQIAGFNHLVESGQVSPGDCVALFGTGVGFSYGCAVVQITETPAWAPTRDH